MRTVITLSDEVHARAKQRAADLGISFAEFVRRLLDRELDAPAPQAGIDSICGMVAGTPFDMARDGDRVIAGARHARLADRVR
ncbi:MAG: hypothetical protein OXG91_03670 [bacterium]|nr:hypothetical protein [bacterium]